MNADKQAAAVKRDVIHVFPLCGGHVLTGVDCWCMPKIERGLCADVVIHNQFAAGVKRPAREC